MCSPIYPYLSRKRYIGSQKMSYRGQAPYISYTDWGSLSHNHVQCSMNIFNRTEECPATLTRCPSATFYPRLLPSQSLLTAHRTLTPPATPPCLCLEALALPARSLPGPPGPRDPSLLHLPPLPPPRSLLAARSAPVVRHRRTVATKPDSSILLLSRRLR